MDSGWVQQRTPTKRRDEFKKPIKVVYISNPMEVKVPPSGFMALVQELTGRDAELPTDLSRFQNPDIDDDAAHQTSDSYNSSASKSTDSHESDHTLVMPHQVDPNFNNFEGQLGGSMEEGFDPFDHHHHHVFSPDQTMDDISAFLLPSVFYESDLVEEEPRRNNGAV